MPPRKPKSEEPPPSGKIENLYEKIPKELLDEADNPNFALHHLKLPFRMCIVAPSGSGKTNFLCNLIGLLLDPRFINFMSQFCMRRMSEVYIFNVLYTK